jgi:hypothetical protein
MPRIDPRQIALNDKQMFFHRLEQEAAELKARARSLDARDAGRLENILASFPALQLEIEALKADLYKNS